MEHEVRQVARGEQQVGAERRALAREIDFESDDADARREPAVLVELPIVRQERFRDDAEDAAARHDDAAVVEAAVAPDRRTDDADGLQVDGGRDQRAKRVSTPSSSVSCRSRSSIE